MSVQYGGKLIQVQKKVLIPVELTMRNHDDYYKKSLIKEINKDHQKL